MLLLRGKGEKEWTAPPARSYESEQALQELLRTSSGLIPGVDPDRSVVAEEVSLGGGSADLVALDADGVITIVECKLAGNPEMRRTVVGQILAYAAALWRLDFESFEAVMARRGVDLRCLATETGTAEGPSSGFDLVRQLVSRTLASGEFRLVIAVDRITGELRSVIEWLNAHTSPRVAVVGLEIDHAEHGGIELVISSVYGEESAATKRSGSSGPSHRWSEEELRAALDRLDPQLAGPLRRLFEHAEKHPSRDSWYWGDGKVPSVTPWMRDERGTTQPLSIYVGGENGTRSLYVNFDWIHRRGKSFDSAAMERFADRLSRLPGMATFADEARSSGWAKRPGIREEVLRDPAVVAGLIEALDDLYGQHAEQASPPVADTASLA